MTLLQVGMYATSRIIAAVARAHLLPPFLARVHHKLGTPYISTILSGVAAAVMALFTGKAEAGSFGCIRAPVLCPGGRGHTFPQAQHTQQHSCFR